MKPLLFVLPAALIAALPAFAQSSSLLMPENAGADDAPRSTSRDPRANLLSPEIAAVSLVATKVPEPRLFELHDLVTIVIRESTQASKSSSISTEKETTIEGEISDFPAFNLADLVQFQLRPSSMSDGNPKVGIELEKEYEGSGRATDNETFTARIQAQIIDVKPNDNIVLEARRYIKNETESSTLILTGICRADDVDGTNSVLSTQLFDLRLVRESTGEIKKATKKGLITRVFETIFNF